MAPLGRMTNPMSLGGFGGGSGGCWTTGGNSGSHALWDHFSMGNLRDLLASVQSLSSEM